MAGRKVFTSGEILTSADVNSFLMDQSVMVFADSSARSSAIPSPSEGMITYLEDTDAVEKFDGSNFVAVTNAAIGSNVVSTTLTAQFTTTSPSMTDITGLAVTITPSSATSKVLLLFAVQYSNTDATSSHHFRLTDGDNVTLVQGDTSGNRLRLTGGGHAVASTSTMQMFSGVFLWSPNATTAQTAKIKTRANAGGIAVINRTGLNTDNNQFPVVVSSITAMEVAG